MHQPSLPPNLEPRESAPTPMEPHPEPVKAALERLGMYVHGTRWMMRGLGVAALSLVAVLWPLNPGPLRSAPVPNPAAPQVPLQEHTTDAVPHVLASALTGAMPRPGNGQKRAGQCDPGRSEVEIQGGCWVRTEHPLPCPEGKQWAHEGRCYLPVFRAERPGTTDPVGEP